MTNLQAAFKAIEAETDLALAAAREAHRQAGADATDEVRAANAAAGQDIDAQYAALRREMGL